MAYQKRPIRRSQLLSPWGVGAIVPFPEDESLMIAGLDHWEYDEKTLKEYIVEEGRLIKRLKVKELRLPPDFNDMQPYKVPAVRFPLWHYCPFCGEMTKVGPFSATRHKCNRTQWKSGRKCSDKGKFRRTLIPERFIVICEKGHIDDFPLMEWVHRNWHHEAKDSCVLRRSTGGVSTSLAGVKYTCSCGASESLLGATRPGALDRISYTCKGNMPWLGNEHEECGKTLKVVQRGGSNVWFGDICSSISIPFDDNVDDSKLQKVLDRVYEKIINSLVDGKLDRMRVEVIADLNNVDADDLYDAVMNRYKGLDGKDQDSSGMSEEEFRLAEYEKLRITYGNENLDLHTVNISASEYHNSVNRYLSSISLVKKLRETRAFTGFSRIQPNSSMSLEDKKSMLSTKNVDWLPAIVVYGEGIFIEFDKENVLKWASKESVQNRAALLSDNYSKFCEKLGKEQIDIFPAYVMIHTLAHILINQLSFDCGYGSSALRERIYCDKGALEHDMMGLLIYTASGDSEGSLGGLVNQGKPGKIEEIIIKALENAKWCTADPICIESKGQGPDSCNLAACHNCALLPETCCENANRLLDRGLLVGTVEDEEIGFFNK